MLDTFHKIVPFFIEISWMVDSWEVLITFFLAFEHAIARVDDENTE